VSFTRLPFDEVFADESGGNIKTPQSEYLREGQFPVVDQGKAQIAGYVDDEERVCGGGRSAIVFGDHTRCVKYIDHPFCMGADGVKVLRPKIDADLKYLYYYLKQLQLPEAGYDRHFKYLKRTEVVLFSLPEQRRIAAILDKADALRAKRRETFTQLDRLAQSIFVEMFGDPATNPKGWPVASLAQVCTIAGEYGAGLSAKEYDPSLPRYVRITDINEQGDLSEEPASPSGVSADWAGYELQAGDVLFARSGATVGKTYLYKESDGPCIFAGYLIRFRPRPTSALSSFVFAFTRTTAYRAWVAARQRVVAQPNINAKQFGDDLILPVPPLELQMEFEKKMAYLAQQKNRFRRCGEEQENLFASLQHRAFRGEL
jgi:type I restriction enzyme S subunit